MEKNKIVIIIFLIVLIVAFSFISSNNKRQIIIKASLYDVAKQINNLNNWKKWNVDLRNDSIKVEGSFNSDQSVNITPTYSYLLHHINPLAVVLTRKIKNSFSTSTIDITSVNDTTTAILWSEKISFFDLIKRNTINHYSRQASLNNLKKLIEDPDNKYGFFIKLVPVKDTLILTSETSANNSSNVVSALYDKLQTFIKENNLPSEKIYFYTTQLSDNKIAVGIPVYKQMNDTKNIKFLQLPGNGRLVEGFYSGNVADKKLIYTAINSFMLDHHLKQVAQPLEQYNVADTVFNNNKDVNLKIYYPVF